MYQYFPKARNADLVVQETRSEVLVYDLKTNEAFCLNETSALIWQACDGTNSVADISSALARKTGTPVADDLVLVGISELTEKSLLEDVDLPSKLTGLSRREMVKRAGIGAMIALPVVASLIAPLPVHAASSCVSGGSCTCNRNSNQEAGQTCRVSVACGDSNCVCRFSNNGNANGTCGP